MTREALTPVWTAGVRREVLPNGLTILVQQVPGSPAVAVVTRVRAGFFDEPDRWAGISHVLEHMFFKGTPTRGVGEIARATRSAGGYLNAGTSYDYTSYYAVLPVRSLAEGLAVQADALRHAAIDGDELSRELKVIIEEAHRKLDSPGAVAHETLHSLLFDHHRIRRWRIGTEAGLSTLGRDDLVAYYQSRYTPGRTIVTVAGGMDAEAAMALAKAHYGDWQRPEAVVAPGPSEPPRHGVRTRTLRGDVTQAYLTLGWRTPPALDGDTLPLDLAAAVLGLGRSSWLYRRLRDPGIVSAVGVSNYTPSEVGVMSVSAELTPDRVEQALVEMAGAVHQLAAVGPAAEDVERVKTMLRARWARRFESAEGRASELASAEALADHLLLEREWHRMQSVTTEEIRDAAARHLVPEGASAVVYLPHGAGVDLAVADLEAAFRRPAGPLASLSPAEHPIVPAPRPAPGRWTEEALHVPLPGVDLLLRRRPGTPTTTVGVYRVRQEFDSAERAGLASLAIRSAIRGAGGYDAEGLADRIERMGGSLGIAVGSELWGFSTTVLTEYLADASVLLDLVMREPRFDPVAVLPERRLLEEIARQAVDDMYRHPIQLAFRAAYGDRGPGLPTVGYPETVAGLAVEMVSDWHRVAVAGGRVTVVAVGAFDPEQAAMTLAGVFSGRPDARAIEPPDSHQWKAPDGERQRFVSRDKAQTAIAMLFPGPGRRDGDRFAAEVWAAHAGGLGGRLFETLRDRRSLAYTVQAYSWQRRAGGGLVSYIATAPGREAEAREQMLVELTRFAESESSPGEIQGAIGYLVGQSEVRRQSATAIAGELLGAFLSGTGLEEIGAEEAALRAVTPGAVRQLAERFLSPSGRAEGVVRGRSSPD